MTWSGGAVDPDTTYLHLTGGHAETLPVDERFWPSVMSGELRLDGWLVGSFAWQPGAEGHSEVHPGGDEVHLCQSGAMSAVLEHPDGEEIVDFDGGELFVIPAGVWHRLEARRPSRVFTMTFGEGTEHRPSPGGPASTTR
ncbi:MAG: cupin domain-containing protein [Actinobacteria bacterium]|nr:cupin domain-containing protein [Actinomycetota bacterium]